MEKMRKEHQTEAMRLQAATRKLELQTSSLETALEQKVMRSKRVEMQFEFSKCSTFYEHLICDSISNTNDQRLTFICYF